MNFNSSNSPEPLHSNLEHSTQPMDNNNFQQDFNPNELLQFIINAYQEARSNLGKCNLLVIGKTGVGKSTLINEVFREPIAKTGVGKPVTQEIRKYEHSDLPLTVYDSPGLELGAQSKEMTEAVSQLIDGKLENVDDQIHIVWYCINHNSNRLEDVEIEWLKELSDKHDVPIIIVVTQTLEAEEDSKFLADLNRQNLPVHQIIPVLAQAKQITRQFTLPQYGLETLMQVTFDLLPEVAEKAFVNAIKSVDIKAKRASKYVQGYSAGAFGIGLSPIPFSDAIPLAAEQIAMLAHITAIFGIPFEDTFLTQIVSGIAGVGGATYAGRMVVSSVLKFIPVVGTIPGSLIAGVTAAGLTNCLGLAYINALTRYMKKKISGQELSVDTLVQMTLKEYLNYLQSGQKDLKIDGDDEEPTVIPIS